MQLQFTHRDQVIRANLHRSSRRTLSITVHPDLKITVRAPKFAPLEIIKESVSKRLNWITEKINYFQELKAAQPIRSFSDGETHYYLGNEYTLQIRPHERNGVALMDDFLVVSIRGEGTSEEVKRLLDRWYAKQCKVVFEQGIQAYLPIFHGLGVSPTTLKIRRMKTRWGSCSNKGVVTLNSELIKVPQDCIDYVIAHELCHLIHLNHSQDFYDLLGRIMPDWKIHKQGLKAIPL